MTHKRRILVVGADEFIGRRVTAALAASDWAIPVTDGLHRNGFLMNDVAMTNGRHASTSLPTGIDVDGVVNCRHGHPREILRTAETLFASLPTDRQIPVIHLSSMSVYGPATGVVAEDAPIRRGLSAYSDAQIDAEGLARTYRQTTILRLGCVYGPDCRQWSDQIADLLLAGRLGDLGAAGDGRCNLIHLDDVAATILVALRTSLAAGETFNLGMVRPPTWNEYFIGFAKVLKAVPVRRITSRQLKIEAKLIAPPAKLVGMMVRKLRMQAPSTMAAITPGMLSLWRQDVTLSMEKAEHALAVRGKTLDDGLREYASARVGAATALAFDR